jgi:hypothetical protein
MAPADFHALLGARPFVPFRIVTPEGLTYEVHHPELCMVGLTSVVVGYPSQDDPATYNRYDIVSPGHIYRLEPLPQPAPPSESNGA